VHVRLAELARWGVPFHRLVIAHELDREGPVRTWLPTLAQEPRTCSDEKASELVGDPPVHPWVARAVRLMDAVVRAATFTARTPAKLGRTLMARAFGVIGSEPPRDGDFCLWYPLAAWRW
jgi:hypothetical protein